LSQNGETLLTKIKIKWWMKMSSVIFYSLKKTGQHMNNKTKGCWNIFSTTCYNNPTTNVNHV